MNLQHPYFFLILIFFTLLYWLTPKTWRLRLATFIGFITWFIFAPFSALFCFILALITYRFTKAPTFLLSIILFASFLIFRASLSHLNLEHGIVPWVGASFFILRCIHYVFYRAQHKSQSSSFEQFFFYLFFPATIL
nr:hypothetical protein [Bacteriovoracaceae bacterium]